MMRIGIDIGGTNTVLGLVNVYGQIKDRRLIATGTYDEPVGFCEAMAEHIIQMLERDDMPLSEVLGIGIGAPNGNHYTGCIENAPNLRFKGHVPLVDILKTMLPLTLIALTNDANAAALGEHEYGNAKGMRDFILITLGTGVGSGIFANGQLVYGHDGFAGEIGHTILYPQGRNCGCGRQGCLEAYASAAGVVKTAIELLASAPTPSMLRQLPTQHLTSKQIGEAAQAGDDLSIQVFDISAKHLALALANSVAHTSPQAIILFGGLVGAGELFLNPLKKYFNSFLLSIYRDKVELMVSGLPGVDAAVLGAASLIPLPHSAVKQ